MAMKRIIDGVHVVPMGNANAYLIEGQDGLALIDAGFPDKEATSAAPPPSCAKPARGPICTRRISRWRKPAVRSGR
jgi:glyoxylase-like metal-dependent hydrolase (beta-lactamase superfamily II)